MLDQIKSFLATGKYPHNSDVAKENDLYFAVAALLIESACSDGSFDVDERRCIMNLLESRFSIERADVEVLLGEAEQAVEGSGQLYGFTRIVKDKYDNTKRVNLIEMLWEVAFADGRVDSFEANVIQRVAGLIYVSDKDRGLARKRVMVRLGID